MMALAQRQEELEKTTDEKIRKREALGEQRDKKGRSKPYKEGVDGLIQNHSFFLLTCLLLLIKTFNYLYFVFTQSHMLCLYFPRLVFFSLPHSVGLFLRFRFFCTCCVCTVSSCSYTLTRRPYYAVNILCVCVCVCSCCLSPVQTNDSQSDQTVLEHLQRKVAAVDAVCLRPTQDSGLCHVSLLALAGFRK